MPSLNELLSSGKTNHRYGSDAQRKEAARRQAAANGLATTALRRLHKADFDDLYRQAISKIDDERGPLPE